jgi:hypothetical protein
LFGCKPRHKKTSKYRIFVLNNSDAIPEEFGWPSKPQLELFRGFIQLFLDTQYGVRVNETSATHEAMCHVLSVCRTCPT